MNKTERAQYARRATDWLSDNLPEGANSHQDDLDNAWIDFEEVFPNIRLGSNNDGLDTLFWDRRKGWSVTINDVT